MSVLDRARLGLDTNAPIMPAPTQEIGASDIVAASALLKRVVELTDTYRQLAPYHQHLHDLKADLAILQMRGPE